MTRLAARLRRLHDDVAAAVYVARLVVEAVRDRPAPPTHELAAARGPKGAPMSDHAHPEPVTDPADLIENKVKASALTTLAASLAFALANGYATTEGVLDPLPRWAQFPILLLLPPLATFLAGYRTPSNRLQ